MKFSEILRNVNDSLDHPNRFVKIRSIDVKLYDGKDRVSTEETVHFAEPLFKRNQDAYVNFCSFLTGLENEQDIPSKINIKIDICSVILFYKSPRAISFLRIPPMDPMDRE